jgi:SH3-like domain-containing protein
MKTSLVWVVAVTVCAGVGQASTNTDVRVTGDRVNLRARPVPDSEVVAQALEGDVLPVLRSEGDWLAVQAPTNAGVWIKAPFVQGNTVLSDRLNIRSGPSLSYRDVGLLHKGDRFTVLETRGEWLRIVPPPGLTLWVSRKVVAPVDADAAAPVTAAGTPAAEARAASAGAAVVPPPAVLTHATLSRELPVEIVEDTLAPVLGQGAVIERTGILERMPMAFLRGVEFRLVDRPDGKKATVCYLRCPEQQAEEKLGQRAVVRGRGYWLNGERAPLIYPDKLETAGPGNE